MRHLMSPLDFSVEELEKLFDLANDIEHNMSKYSEACKGKKLALILAVAMLFSGCSGKKRMMFGTGGTGEHIMHMVEYSLSI